MYYNIDQQFFDYFNGRVKQVFLYLIDKCNLDCEQCLYKPNNYFHLVNKEIQLSDAIGMITDMYELGARKLTLMGGEPTLYGKEDGNKPLLALICEAKKIGYEYIRIDTNGTFDPALLLTPEFQLIDEITFSLDGPTAEINDRIRGNGVFDKCTNNIREAIKLGYHCDITCCIHKGLIKRDTNGVLLLSRMIQFAESIGVRRINFHDLFKTGLPRDSWTGSLDISVDEWFEVWSEISTLVDSNYFGIPVRIPQCFTTPERFNDNSSYYGYCSAKLGERVLVHPDGIIRICSLLIGTPYGVAKYYNRRIVWDDSPTNELNDQDLSSKTPCTHQNKHNRMSPFVPLCVSFKPNQDEFIWQKIKWEQQKKK